MDGSLLSALPSSCKKSAEERGSFDVMVLDQVSKYFTDRQASFSKTIDEAAPAAAQRASAVAQAAADLDKASALQQAAAEDLNVASNEEQLAAQAKTAAEAALASYEPEYSAATKARDDKIAEAENFKLYNVGCFELLRDRASETPSEAVVG